MTTRFPVTAEQWCGESREHWRGRWRLPQLLIFAETASTNDEARALAQDGAAAGTAVIAEHQWAGRGREGRAWRDEPGLSLLLSVILRPATGMSALGPIPLRVGMTVCNAIEQCASLPVRLKWPNDVLVPDGRKLAGILCEATSGPGGTFVIAGIGINVLQSDDAWKRGDEATSILAAAGGAPSRADIAGAILEGLRPFEIRGTDLDENEMLEFRHRDALRGASITVDGRPAGIADGIRPDGTLVVMTGNTTHTLQAGTVRTAPHPAAGRSDKPPTPQHTETP